MTSEERAGVLSELWGFPEEIRASVKDMLDQHAVDQRQECADAVIAELKSIGFQIYQLGEARIRDACLGGNGRKNNESGR